MKRACYIAGCAAGVAAVATLMLFAKPAAVSSAAFRCVAAARWALCGANLVITGKDGWLFYKPELAYIVRPLQFENVGRIAAFDSTLRDHGILLFVMPIPNKIEIYPEKFCPIPAPHPVKHNRRELLRRLAAAGVRVIDIVPALEKTKTEGRVFDPFDTHWTPLGIEAAAQTVANSIDSALTAREIPRDTRYLLRDTTLMANGDLLKKVAKDAKSSWYPLRVRQVLCSDGRFYRDEKNAEVLIIGDSFVSRCRWWSAHLGAQLARYIGRPTRTYSSVKANTEGPCMYTKMPALFKPGGIVIWAFTSRVLRVRLGCGEKKE